MIKEKKNVYLCGSYIGTVLKILKLDNLSPFRNVNGIVNESTDVK